MGIDYLTSVRDDTDRLAAAVRKGPGTATVAACPGWDLTMLIAHVGRIHHWVLAALDAKGENPGKYPPAPEDPAEYPEWLVAGSAEMCARLAALDPETPVWHFGGDDGPAAFWSRRQALETAVHRWDAEAAIGEAATIDPALAVDGIDEIFTVFGPLRAGKPVTLGGSLHLHTTDADGEWTISAPDGVVHVERGHAKGDAAVRGPASTLYLMLWRRVAPTHPDLETFGDAALVEQWLGAGIP